MQPQDFSLNTGWCDPPRQTSVSAPSDMIRQLRRQQKSSSHCGGLWECSGKLLLRDNLQIRSAVPGLASIIGEDKPLSHGTSNTGLPCSHRPGGLEGPSLGGPATRGR